jgi:hypothetical protein
MKPKQLPRLWCALQGLLPLESRRTNGTGVEPNVRPRLRVKPSIERKPPHRHP